MQNFPNIELKPELLQSLDALGFTTLTPIQTEALPIMLDGRDVVAQAQTGSGKTGAFGLAILQTLEVGRPSAKHNLQSLVLCPTRELADQVAQALREFARTIPNVKISSLCGGVSIRDQLASLVHMPHIVVGTPGRIRDLLQRKALHLNDVNSIVLDEADRMLDMGFIDEIDEILEQAPAKRQTWLFSATYPDEIKRISHQYQTWPAQITIASAHDDTSIEQQFFEVELADKPAVVANLLHSYLPESCLIFCNTKNDVRELVATLNHDGIHATGLHGDLEQRDRDEALLKFVNGSTRVLVATDVAARGLDVKELPLVMSYELPHDPEIHVHRIGRTGRAGASGAALSLVAPREIQRAIFVEDMMGIKADWASLPDRPDKPTTQLPEAAMQTLLLDAGRKDKIRPGDILGALTRSIGLPGSAIGKIDCQPNRAYVAVASQQAKQALQGLNAGKIKGKKIRVRRLK